jgi:hypothetical protein
MTLSFTINMHEGKKKRVFEEGFSRFFEKQIFIMKVTAGCGRNAGAGFCQPVSWFICSLAGC